MNTATEPVATAPEEDRTFTIPGLTWDQYVAIGDALGDRAGLRTLFLDGRLTFVSPGYAHEWSEDVIDKIVLAIAVGCEIDLGVVGSTTLRKGSATGLEGDRVYYLGENVARVGHPDQIDLAIHPPPDLAIEVENSRKADDAMAIYARFGVPEVWRVDVKNKSLTFWTLDDNAVHQSSKTSLAFPFLSTDDVTNQWRRAEAIQNQSRWFAELTRWVRDVIRPRIDRP